VWAPGSSAVRLARRLSVVAVLRRASGAKTPLLPIRFVPSGAERTFGGVPRPSFPGSIVEFQRRFADEDACRAYLFQSRWPDGFACRICGSSSIGVLHRRGVWQCKQCGKQSSVTAGTVMHGTRTPLTLWFWAAYLVATHTPGISAVQLQRQLSIARYETAWLILHKLRRAMIAPERGLLRDQVEVDEALIGGRHSGRRGGRQREGKTVIGVAVEVRGQGSGRLRLQVLPDASGEVLEDFVGTTVTPGAIVDTDGWRGYLGLRRAGYDHIINKQRFGFPDHQFVLPRAHRAVSNLKTWLQGTHRGVSPDHLQVYLDEFVFRHNRRRTPLAAFQTLLGLGTLHPPTPLDEITATSQTEPTG
jgi:ribosomal protein L37AE/L43A/transposase-like protein